MHPEQHHEISPPAYQLDRHEWFNTLTHGLGVALSIIAAIVLYNHAAASGDGWRILGCSIFAVTLVGVYTASTLSHCVVDPGWRAYFRSLDQALIYLLIAGSYTPFALLYLRFSWWWLLTAAMWMIALWGFVSKIVYRHRVDFVSLRSYLMLGWLPILPAFKYFEYIPLGALAWVLAGGLYYSVGAIFFFLDLKRYYFHAIWHTLVMAGSACHFFGVLIFVAYPPQV